ncbi:reverse transcriptase domain-containing protein (chloroplast) [Artemisia annua]|uniref:Reverse transcriptase domain-containing protein n=1 Tax=Artemisia annua TaxID=35608 RepID=A0A2U1QFU7_ARTAN|nr:reverse transcriptase domain-containing protein [Artemisia annua]
MLTLSVITIQALVLSKQKNFFSPQPSSHAQVKAVEENCVTCGRPHAYYNCTTTDGSQFDFKVVAGPFNEGGNQYRPQVDPNYRASNQNGPPGFSQLNNPNRFNQNQPRTQNVQNQFHAPINQYPTQGVNFNEGFQAPNYQAPNVPSSEFANYIKANEANMRAMQNQIMTLKNDFQSSMLRQGNELKNELRNINHKIEQSQGKIENMFASLMNQMNQASTSGTLPGNTIPNPKGELKAITTRSVLRMLFFTCPSLLPLLRVFLVTKRLFELTKTHLNENCSAVLLKKLPEKLRDPRKFLIPYDFQKLEECFALADLGASINLMPLSIWQKLSLPELTPTRMTLELATRTVTVPKGEMTLRVGDEKLVINIENTSKDLLDLEREVINQIDVIDVTCDEYFHEVLNVKGSIDSTIDVSSPSLTPFEGGSIDSTIDVSSPSLTPFEGGDFILEEIEACLSCDSRVDHDSIDPEEDILLLEKLLNDDPSSLPPKELHNEEIKSIENSKDPPEGDDKLPDIIAKDLNEDDKAALIKVLKSHKRAITWKRSDIKGINPEFCMHKILMEDDFKQAVQQQRRVNPKIHEIIKKEVIKILDAGLIYPISDSPYVSLIHCVPKKGDITVVKNDENELIPTRLVTGWRVCIDYRKLNDATCKDHFPLPFMDQMPERLAGNEYYCFLDGFSGYFQIPIDPQDQEKTTFTCPYGTLAYRRMPFGLCNAIGTFQRCMMAIFHDMIEKTMEVFMDDFSVVGNSFESCLTNLDKMLQRC